MPRRGRKRRHQFTDTISNKAVRSADDQGRSKCQQEAVGTTATTAIEHDDLNAFLEEFKQGKPKRLTIFNVNLYAVVRFILDKAADILPEIEDFAKLSPKMLPFILNGPSGAKIVPQAALPGPVPMGKEGQPLSSSAGKMRNSAHVDSDNQVLEVQKPSSRLVAPQKGSTLADVQTSAEVRRISEDHASPTQYTSPEIAVEQSSLEPETASIGRGSPQKTHPSHASSTQTHCSSNEQRSSNTVGTGVTVQDNGTQAFQLPSAFQFANSGWMGHNFQYGVPTQPQPNLFSQSIPGPGQHRPQTSTPPHHPYIPQVQQGWVWAPRPVQQLSNSPVGYPVQPGQLFVRGDASNRSVQLPPGHHA